MCKGFTLAYFARNLALSPTQSVSVCFSNAGLVLRADLRPATNCVATVYYVYIYIYIYIVICLGLACNEIGLGFAFQAVSARMGNHVKSAKQHHLLVIKRTGAKISYIYIYIVLSKVVIYIYIFVHMCT